MFLVLSRLLTKAKSEVAREWYNTQYVHSFFHLVQPMPHLLAYISIEVE